MKLILIILFGVMVYLKLAAIGVMATASWWLVCSPLLVLVGGFVLRMIILSNVFPRLTLLIAKNVR